MRVHKILSMSIGLMAMTLVVGCPDDGDDPFVPNTPSIPPRITSFRFENPSVIGTIIDSNGVINIVIPFGTATTALTPVIEVSEGSIVSPASGETRDFTGTVLYTVTSTNDHVVKLYGANVSIAWDSVDRPSIKIMSVPDLGQNGSALGQVAGIPPSEYDNYKVAIYIYVGGLGWWIKPYVGSTVSVLSNGTWGGRITTGGVDSIATQIAAYLVPRNVDVPQLLGAASLPDALAGYPIDIVYR